MESQNNNGSPDRPDFFIFGVERSGTTMLSFLLSSQPGIFVLNDSFIYDQFIKMRFSRGRKGLLRIYSSLQKRFRFIRSLGRAIKKEAALQRSVAGFDGTTPIPYAQAASYHAFLRQRYLRLPRHTKQDEKKSAWLAEYATNLDTDEIVLQSGFLSLSELLSNTYQILARPYAQKNDTVYGEKSPVHTFYHEWIMRLYPDSSAILLIRNPITNIASLYNRNDYNLDLVINIYRKYIPELVRLSNSPRCKVYRYEDLLEDPRQVVPDMMAYIAPNCTFDKSLPMRPYIKAEYVGGGIDKTRDEALWDLFSEAQQSQIIDQCRPIFELHYPDFL